jgi:glycosyltransferase involved in cell wall biosynthesis
MCLLPDLNGGGAERVMIYLLRGLDRERFDITLALGRATGELMPLIPPDIQVIVLGRDRAAASVFVLAREFRRGYYDICFSMVSMNLAAVLARLLSRDKVRLVLGARSHYTKSIGAEASAARTKLAAVRFLYPLADLVIAVSDGVRADLVANVRVPPSKVITIHNPIDIDKVRALAATDPGHPWLSTEQRIPVLIAVGSLRMAKGYPDLLDGFASIRAARQLRLLILGEGPLRGEIEDRIRRLGIQEDVSLLGFQDNPHQYVARATLFVLSSLWEGFPNVLIEARVSGTAVVTTDCESGPREIVHDGEDGSLVPVSSPLQLASAITSLLDDEPKRRLFGERGRRDVERFAVKAIIGRYAQVFEDVLRTRP